MDRLVQLNPSLRPSSKVGEKRSSKEDLDAGAELGPKRIKMRDLESVLRSEGVKVHRSEHRVDHLFSSKEDGITQTTDNAASKDGISQITETAASKDEISQITETAASIDEISQNTEIAASKDDSPITETSASTHSNGPQSTITRPTSVPLVVGASACLSSGDAGSSQSPMNTSGDAVSVQVNASSHMTFPQRMDKDHESNSKPSTGLGLDLNVVAASVSVDHNPFYPYKTLGSVRPTDDSECGSTTGPLEESEPLRMWKEMKQNGFLSSSRGGIPPVPKQHGRSLKKRREDEFKKKVELGKREQGNRFSRVAAPSGLLSGLNPGIINHVRNSKQVHSIIEAIVRSEKLDGQIRNQSGRTNKDVRERTDPKGTRNSESRPFYLPPSRLYSFSVSEGKGEISSESDMGEERFGSESVTSHLTSGCEDDSLTLKLSSTGTMASENVSSMTNDHVSANEEIVDSLSLKAATVASQWLELLFQDIRGRLAALRRSRKRVRNVIQTELPYLLSTELSSNQENNPQFLHTMDAQASNNTTSNMHVARWKSLFSQMDMSLSEEGKHLESWLEEVKEMQLHCEKGLKSVSEDGLSLYGSSHDPRLKQGEGVERGRAVRAAAASIYSTCNLIMTNGNVPCF